MFRAFADVQTPEMLDLPRPKLEGGKAIVVACPMSDEQAALQQELVARYERLRTEKVDPREDNALAITTDGRKLALDARLLSAKADDHPDSKINALAGERRRHLAENRRDLRGHADDFLRYGGRTRRPGVIPSTTRSSTNSSPPAFPPSRSPPSATPIPTPRNNRCSTGCAAARCAC